MRLALLYGRILGSKTPTYAEYEPTAMMILWWMCVITRKGTQLAMRLSVIRFGVASFEDKIVNVCKMVWLCEEEQ